MATINSGNTTVGFGTTGGDSKPPSVDFAYEFKFVNTFSDEVFNACPDACPGLREIVCDVCSTLSVLMEDASLQGSSINIAVSFNSKAYDVCVTCAAG